MRGLWDIHLCPIAHELPLLLYPGRLCWLPCSPLGWQPGLPSCRPCPCHPSPMVSYSGRRSAVPTGVGGSWACDLELPGAVGSTVCPQSRPCLFADMPCLEQLQDMFRHEALCGGGSGALNLSLLGQALPGHLLAGTCLLQEASGKP